MCCTMKLSLLALALTSSCLVFSESKPFILNGVISQQRPYMVDIQLLVQGTWKHLCGGSLLTTKKVLSAAHCMKNYGVVPHRALLGFLDISEQPEGNLKQIINITGVTPHPEYNQGPRYFSDVGLFTLQTDAVLSERVGLVKLSALTAKELVGEKVLVEGWGALGGDDDAIRPDVLQHLDMEVQSNDYCERMIGSRADEHVCTMDVDKPIGDVCFGDSGSPLMHNAEQVGVLSFGTNPCGLNGPSVFASVAYFRDWIDANKN